MALSVDNVLVSARPAFLLTTVFGPGGGDSVYRGKPDHASRSAADLALAPVGAEQSLFTAANQTSSPNEGTPGSEQVLGTLQPGGVLQNGPGVPDPRGGFPEVPQLPKPPVKMPWADGVASMDIIFAKLLEGERRRAIARYIELLGTVEAFVDDLSAASDPAFRAQVAELLLKDL
ncbi:hypothetical protein [Streptomyces sp. NPDC058279]|uniref:hypothetical protein n=1 Tax=Streptomyces sp. NPDC058279 TaxID=3346418 RepID=UPI0036ECE449